MYGLINCQQEMYTRESLFNMLAKQAVFLAVPSMKNADVRVMENSSREILLEWTPPRYIESDNVQFLVECFKGLQKIVELVQPHTRVEFDNLEPNTSYRFQVTPVQGKERKPHGNSVYAKLKTKANVKGIISKTTNTTYLIIQCRYEEQNS